MRLGDNSRHSIFNGKMQTLFRLLIFHLLLSHGPNGKFGIAVSGVKQLESCIIVTPSLCFAALGSEIINGKKVPDDLMLYMVSLQNRFEKHICGGFLIREDFVLTAAHCDCKWVNFLSFISSFFSPLQLRFLCDHSGTSLLLSAPTISRKSIIPWDTGSRATRIQISVM